jgi:hypothetical protein
LGESKHDCTFYAVWNKIFDATYKYRDDFGNKPQQAVVNLHDFRKMTNLVPPLQPEENCNDMLLVLPYKVAQIFCLRAGQEVRLFCIFVLTIPITNTFFDFFQLYEIKVSQLKFSTVSEGKYQVLEKVNFSHSYSDKTCKLSLINYSLRESGTDKNDTDIISDPHDHLCTVCLLKYHFQFNLPTNHQVA